MRALVCRALTGIAGLAVVDDWPAPEPGLGQVRIAVAAAGLNFPDLLMLSGAYQFKPVPPFVPGMEGAGTIAAIAPDVDAALLGQRVMFSARGTFASLAVATVGELMPVPDAWTLAEAAAFPVVAKTAFHALVHRAGLKRGETLLVHGASGGTGHMAVKLGNAIGARVIATTGTMGKAVAIRGFGADVVLDGRAPDLAARIKAATDGRGVDVVFDPVGGALFEVSLKAAAFAARVLIIGFVADAPNQVRTNYALIKGLSILGVRAGEAARADPAIADSYRRELPRLASGGDARPHVQDTYDLAEAAVAFDAMRQRTVTGKLVLRP